MKDAETEQRQYEYRPVIYFHAADHAQAMARVSHLRSLIEDAISEADETRPKIKDYTYDDVHHDLNSLVADSHYGAPREVVK